MNLSSALAFAATLLCCALAVTVILGKRRSVVSYCFAAGMLVFAFESVAAGMTFQAGSPEEVAFWQTLAFLAKSLEVAVWLCFSIMYSRGDYRESLARSRLLLMAAFAVPVAMLIGASRPFFEPIADQTLAQVWWIKFHESAKILNALILVFSVLILMNLERTFRSAVGTMRWRIKFLVLGLGIIFGAGIYVRSQALLFSGQNLAFADVETGSLLIGSILMAVAYFRSDFVNVDVYPSRTALQTSLTLLLAGGYLLVVGVLAQIVARIGAATDFQVQALIVLLAIVLLAVLLLSDRFRRKVRVSLSHHFQRPQFDSRKVWSSFTQSLSKGRDESGLCARAVKLISSTFDVLSVTIWLYDESKPALIFAASTSESPRNPPRLDLPAGLTALRAPHGAFNLETAPEGWAESLRQISTSQFREGGDRTGIPLVAGERWLGLVILADRVGGGLYTIEEYDLLQCIGDQIAASLLNLRLSSELMLGKEWEAFQTISAFFVHDLKNTASTLNLMLQNLPVHFDDPAFRHDALRGIGKTADRINELIDRLSALRHKLELKRTECDLNHVLSDALESVKGFSEMELVKELNPVPKLLADREQLQSVITNLLVNARDAVDQKGKVIVRTDHTDGWVALSVVDNGCGMSPTFLRESLFRPFQTTKKKGLGIGMFQSKMIVEAHRGTIQVTSEVGVGTTFRVLLPLKAESA